MASCVLEVQELRDVGVGEDVMAAADSAQLEAGHAAASPGEQAASGKEGSNPTNCPRKDRAWLPDALGMPKRSSATSEIWPGKTDLLRLPLDKPLVCVYQS